MVQVGLMMLSNQSLVVSNYSFKCRAKLGLVLVVERREVRESNEIWLRHTLLKRAYSMQTGLSHLVHCSDTQNEPGAGLTRRVAVSNSQIGAD